MRNEENGNRATADSASRKQSPRTDIRLQKYLADCGLGSRRACERIIEQGRVSVDDAAVKKAGVCVYPGKSVVRVDGKIVCPQDKVYFLFNKPRDVICTASDPSGRRTFLGFFSAVRERVYTIGRLDRDSEGLIIVTNDGDLAFKLAHPRHHVAKTYDVWVSGQPRPDIGEKFIDGIRSRGELLRTESVERIDGAGSMTRFRVVLREGRNRQLRRMFEAVGLKVEKLRRIAVGDLQLGGLRSGSWREMSGEEKLYFEKLAKEGSF